MFRVPMLLTLSERYLNRSETRLRYWQFLFVFRRQPSQHWLLQSRPESRPSPARIDTQHSKSWMNYSSQQLSAVSILYYRYSARIDSQHSKELYELFKSTTISSTTEYSVLLSTRIDTQHQCCWSRMFYPRSGSDHFLIPDPDQNIFSSRILHEKWNAN
jgi:hypothetical protein